VSANVLFVVHTPAWADNRISDLLRERGIQVIPSCPRLGDPLPTQPAGYDGIIVGGGLDSVNDAGRAPYMADLVRFTRREVAAGTPFLGICLGAQVLAAAYGGTVHERPDGAGQVGYRRFRRTREGEAVLGELDTALFCHSETFTLPRGAERLAAGAACANHAFRLGDRAYGFQFHPEIPREGLRGFMADVPEMLAMRGADAVTRQETDAAVHDGRVGRWLERFLEHWLPRT